MEHTGSAIFWVVIITSIALGIPWLALVWAGVFLFNEFIWKNLGGPPE